MFRLRTRLQDLVLRLDHRAPELSAGSQARDSSNIRDLLGWTRLNINLYQRDVIFLVIMRNQTCFLLGNLQ